MEREGEGERREPVCSQLLFALRSVGYSCQGMEHDEHLGT